MMETEEKLTLDDNVLLSDGNDYRLVKLRDVRFFETYGNYSKTYFSDGKLLIYRSLNYLDERLSGRCFFRANRQQILNLSHIRNVELLDNSFFRVEMSCGKKIDLSRRRSKEFKGEFCI
ncbi:LytTR family transcriptional regulator [Rhodohalobacter sp. SW132]|uniref:LytR/AlgR family response regulator transcription factor n=1 Tax=Rhodohalobacter sp. SW132 TaxID=2293433 RepID=UPI000E23A994|nr:LytTR family DNA-binding domain-containing protein [Rhodohalobacter sp. SW132]REL24647.1 LytTR family transcriptional regulator [Rhodohalobacter sp. SW132]